MSSAGGERPPKIDREERRAKRHERRTKRQAAKAGIDTGKIREEAAKITNPARQKVMLEAADEIDALRREPIDSREQRRRLRDRERIVRDAETKTYRDEEGRLWVLRKEVQPETKFADEFGRVYIYSDGVLKQITG